MRLAHLLAFVAVLAAGAAHGQLRTIPEEAKRGTLRHVQDRLVEIDGVRERLAPGAQIRDTANRLVLPTAVPAGTVVRYLRDAQGELRYVWILSAKEAAGR